MKTTTTSEATAGQLAELSPLPCSAPCVAVVSPAGEVIRVFAQVTPLCPRQEDSLLADAWHKAKPDDDFSPCTLPNDADTARRLGYRVITGMFLPNANDETRREMAQVVRKHEL